MDIPDKTQHLCNDALYIFDSDTVMEGPLVSKHGDGCGIIRGWGGGEGGKGINDRWCFCY